MKGLDKWYESLRFTWENLPDALIYALLSVATLVFIISFCFSIVRVFTRACAFDLAGRDDILKDKLHDAFSFYDGTYELPKENIKKAMIYANLSYHTFWNAVIMYRYRTCGDPWNRMYFRVNRWNNHNWFPLTMIFFQYTMLCSLCFLWGYPIFWAVTRVRMKLYAKKQPLY